MAFDFTGLLSDPNFLKYVGNVGAGIGSGQNFAQAVGGQNLAQQIEGPANQDVAQQIFAALSGKVTPQGQDGPTNLTLKKNADKTTVSFDEESSKNKNTFGQSVPVEIQNNSQPVSVPDPNLQPVTQAQPGDNQSPFFKALLG